MFNSIINHVIIFNKDVIFVNTRNKTIIKVISIFFFYCFFSLFVKYIISLFGIDINNLSINTTIIISIITSLIQMGVLYIIYRKEINNSIKDFIKNFKEYMMFGSKIWIIGVLVMFLSNYIINSFYIPIATNESVIHSLTLALPLYMIFSSLIFTPFIEEIIFRVLPRELFKDDVLYIIMCGLIFGFVHSLAGLTGETLIELVYIIPYGAVGAAFAYMYAKKKNIFIPIVFHLIHNSIILSFYLLELL